VAPPVRQHADNCRKVQAELGRWQLEIERSLDELTAAFPLAVPDITAEQDRGSAASASESDEELDDGQLAIDALERLAPVSAQAAAAAAAAAAAGGVAGGLGAALGGGSESEMTVALGTASKVAVNSRDSEAVLDVIAEGETLLSSKFIPKVAGWIARIQGNTAAGAGALLPQLLALRTRLVAAVDKCQELQVIRRSHGGGSGAPSRSSRAVADASEDEDDDDDEDEGDLVDVEQFQLPDEYLRGDHPAALGSGESGAGAAVDGAGPAAAHSRPTRQLSAVAATRFDPANLQRLADLGLIPQSTVAASAKARGKQPLQAAKKKVKKRKPETALVDLNSPAVKSRKKLKQMVKRPPGRLKQT
jgi:hypothetical protein